MGRIWIILSLLLLVSGCSASGDSKEATVGLLLTDPIEDQDWNQKGFDGAMELKEKLEAEVHVRENVRSLEEVEQAVEELAAEGVNLLFGHSSWYADMFMNIKDKHEDIHFVSFNEQTIGENVTSLHFEGYAMGYFAGMLAAETSANEHISIIAAFPYQPEVKGFSDGAMFHNEDVEVNMHFTESWVDSEKALHLFEEDLAAGADVFYPAGDGFHHEVIQLAEANEVHAIGYVSDQHLESSATVLTSTVQNVEEVYKIVGDDFVNGQLESGNLSFDFQEDAISLGRFSESVSASTEEWLMDAVERYKETGLLPHEQNEEG